MSSNKLNSKIVDTSQCVCIGNREYNARYYFHIKIKPTPQNKGNTAIVILKNPSSTARANVFYGVPFNKLTDIDATTNNIIIQLNGYYERIITLNLFPYFDSHPSTLNGIFPIVKTNKGHRYINDISYFINFKIINHTIKQNPNANIICAWGRANSGMYKRLLDTAINHVASLLNGTPIYEYDGSAVSKIKPYIISNSQYPLHACRW